MFKEVIEKIASLREKRLAICNSCPSNQYAVCIECACIIQTKILLEGSTCPLNKWNEESTDDTTTI
jgi:hypothetical protein